MADDKARLELAKWVLERHLGWVAAAEVKVGVVVALDTAMLAALAAAFGASQAADRTAWTYLATLVAAGAGSLGIFCSAMSVMPRVQGPESLLFFGKVACHKRPDYVAAFRSATDAQLLDDCLEQVHRNAEIAVAKFGWVRKAMGWSFFFVVPWIAALGLLVMTCPPRSVPVRRNNGRATERKRDAQEQVHGRADHRVHQAG